MVKRFINLFAAVSLAAGVSFARDNETEPVKIIKQPKPAPSGCGNKSGYVRLRLTFHESGKVAETAVEKSTGCAAFEREARIAAFRIKFRPARKDGRNITVNKSVEYVFIRP
jgi:TonB family protein